MMLISDINDYDVGCFNQRIVVDFMQTDQMGGRYDNIKEVTVQIDHTNMGMPVSQTHFVTIKRFCITKPKQLLYPGHDYLEVIFCQKGGAVYRFEEREYTLEAGDILVIHPNIAHRFLFPLSDHQSFEGILICISPDTAQIATGFVFLVSGSSGYSLHRKLPTAGTKWEFLMDQCEAACSDAERHQIGWQGVLFGNVFTLLGLICRAIFEDMSVDHRQQLLFDSILQYIRTNLSEKITAKDIAQRFYISESYLGKLFRKRLDTSFYKFVMQNRLQLARQLMGENIPSEQICTKTGFCDYAALYRAFKNEFGITPQEYRKSIS